MVAAHAFPDHLLAMADGRHQAGLQVDQTSMESAASCSIVILLWGRHGAGMGARAQRQGCQCRAGMASAPPLVPAGRRPLEGGCRTLGVRHSALDVRLEPFEAKPDSVVHHEPAIRQRFPCPPRPRHPHRREGHQYRHRGRGGDGPRVEPAQIAKTLSLWLKDEVVLLVMGGDTRIDNRKYKDRFGAKAKMLNADEVQQWTGHPVGGGLPFRPAARSPHLCRRVAAEVRGSAASRGCHPCRGADRAGAPAQLVKAEWVDVAQEQAQAPVLA